MNWYLKVFRNYFDFEGRARRSEYWIFLLYNFSFATILFIVDAIFGWTLKSLPFGWLYILYCFVSIIPGFAVTVRRLHDIGKSGWAVLLCLIPFVGAIWLSILLMLNSDSQKNEYGENPKLEPNTDDFSNVDSIIQLVIVWMLINILIYKVTTEFVESDVFGDFYKSIYVYSSLLWSIIPISLAFVIKNKNKRVTFLILGAIYFIYSWKAVFDLLKDNLFKWYLFS